MKYAWIQQASRLVSRRRDVRRAATSRQSGYYASIDRAPSPRARRARADQGGRGPGSCRSRTASTAASRSPSAGRAGRAGVGLSQHGGGRDARTGPEKPRPQGLYADHHPGRSDEAAGAEQARPRLHGRGAESQVGHRHHLPARRPKAGSTWPWCSTCSAARSSAGRSASSLATDAGRRGACGRRSNRGGRPAKSCCITAIAAASTRATPTSRP